MAKLDLTQYGITGSTVIAHNPSYEVLFEEETKAGLTGFDKGQNTELNAVNVMTGIYTQVHREGCTEPGQGMVDHRGVQERQPPHERGGLGKGEGHCHQGALQQEPVCC